MISALMDLLNTCYECGDFALMETVAQTVQHTIPDDVVSLHFLGLAYLRTGRKRDALALLNKLRQRGADKPGLDNSLAGTSIVPDTHTAATGCYLEATKLNPQLAKTWHEVALEVEQITLGACK